MRTFVAVAGLLFLAVGSFAQAPAETEPVASSDYTIGVEDVLHVSVWGERDLSVSVKVRPDGKITLPLVNDVLVKDLTADQVRQLLATRLAGFIKDPNVSVAVAEINSFRVYVLGEVNRQGPINLFRSTRLLQVIASAGGLTQFSKKELTVLRDEGGVERRIRVDYKKLIAGDASEVNLYLRPGDTVVVN